MKIFKKRKLSEEIEKYDNYRLAEVLELKDDIQPVADVAQADAFKSIKKLDRRAKEAFKEVEKNVEPVVKSTHNRNLGIVDKTDAMKKMGLVESFNKKFPSVDYSISHKNKGKFLKVYTESLNQAKSISTWASSNKIPCYIKKSKGVYNCVLKEEWVDEDACRAGIAQDLNYLIKDELEAVDGYNSVLATWKDADKFPEVIAVLKDIVDEEMLHIGQLQRALELVSPNAKNIQAGAKEAEEQIVDEAEKQKEKEIEKAEEKFRDKIDVEVEDSVEDIEDGEKEVVDIDVVEESKKCKTKKLSEDYVNINKTELVDFIKESVQSIKHYSNETHYYPLTNNLYFVMGAVTPVGYDKEELKSFELTEEGYVICGKIAVNSDDLQMDYAYDWTIPYYKDGEVVEDEITILKGTNYNDLASYIIRRVKELSKFDISKEGLITESIKSSKLEKEGIQYFGTKNKYNYDKIQLRIDHDNKTYQLGAFTHISKRETVSTPELKRIIERLKEMGYKEIKKDNLKEETEFSIFTQIPEEELYDEADYIFDNDGLYGENFTDGIIIDGKKNFTSKIYSKDHRNEILDLLNNGYSTNEIVQNLNKITGKKYTYRQISGYSQSDWANLYYPEGEFKNEFLDVIEDAYFGNYTAYDGGDNGVVVVFDSDSRPVKKIISEETGIPENQIKIRKFDGYIRTPKYIDEKVNKPLKSARKLEDVKKLPNGKWANVGKDGKANSGTFKTKKEAEAQMRAMYANGYKESIKKEGMKDTLDAYVKGETLEERYEPYSSFKTFEYKDKTEQGYDVVKIFRDLDDDRVHIIFHRTKPEDYNIGLGYSLDDGVWNQGRYNFNSVEDAEEILKGKYNVEDITDTFKEEKIEVKEDLEEEKIEKGPFQVIWYVMEDDHPRCECFKEREKAIEYCNKHKEDNDKLEMQAVEVNDKDEIVDYLVL